jgi:hypothetical protein
MTRRDLMRTAPLAALGGSTLQAAAPQNKSATVSLSLEEEAGPMDMGRMALGQGGLSEDRIWDSRLVEIKALKPKLIRLFIQEYFNLLPAEGKYHFDTLDQSVELILQTGAKPLMNIDFKPALLYPKVDQDIVEPTDWSAWEDLISELVAHYAKQNAGIQYWEIANEPDIGEDGGCPYRFRPDNYTTYYQHTAEAILKADPNAKVGGPALANYRSPILPALLDFCQAGKAPLHFVSWHIYNSDPQKIRQTIEHVKQELAARPALHPETILNEWNMSLSNPSPDPRFQPCFVAETIWQMMDAGLDYSCYYHIRDYPVDQDVFSKFMSPQGAAFMARWWNRMPQFDGLFDYQNTMRPAYFTFKLLSRLTGTRLGLKSSHPAVHGFAAHDQNYELYNLMVWNFSADPVDISAEIAKIPAALSVRRLSLDAMTGSNDENLRLRPIGRVRLAAGTDRKSFTLDPYAVEFWSMEKARS